MPTILQLRRGTTAENAAYTAAAGEITVDTPLNKVLLHDGSTAGGAETVGSIQGNIQLGKTAAGEIDTSSGNLTIDSAGGTITLDDNVTISGNLTVSGTTTTVDSTTVSIQNAFVFEGATDDAHETTLTTVDPTADRTISLPNATDISEKNELKYGVIANNLEYSSSFPLRPIRSINKTPNSSEMTETM